MSEQVGRHPTLIYCNIQHSDTATCNTREWGGQHDMTFTSEDIKNGWSLWHACCCPVSNSSVTIFLCEHLQVLHLLTWDLCVSAALQVCHTGALAPPCCNMGYGYCCYTVICAESLSGLSLALCDFLLLRHNHEEFLKQQSHRIWKERSNIDSWKTGCHVCD